MPNLGESETDSWRDYCFFTVTPAAISLPFLVFFVCEPPVFYLLHRNPAKCAQALAAIAEVNGKTVSPDLMTRIAAAVPPQPPVESSSSICTQMVSMVASLWRDLSCQGSVFFLVLGVDGLRTTLVSGSSYLVPQLLEFVHAQHENATPSPSVANILAETTPVLGLILAVFLRSVDAKTMSLSSCLVTAAAIGSLTTSFAVDSWMFFVFCIMMMKGGYGPLSSCVTLLKAAAFPAESRATAFAAISLIAKFGTAAAPTIIEVLRGKSWTLERLNLVLHCLLLCALLCGFLVVLVPGWQGIGVSKTVESSGSSHYGSIPSSEARSSC
jgi:hypothetical protein